MPRCSDGDTGHKPGGGSVGCQIRRDSIQLVPSGPATRQLDGDLVLDMPRNDVHVDVWYVLLGIHPIGKMQVDCRCESCPDSAGQHVRCGPERSPLFRREPRERWDVSARDDKDVARSDRVCVHEGENQVAARGDTGVSASAYHLAEGARRSRHGLGRGPHCRSCHTGDRARRRRDLEGSVPWGATRVQRDIDVRSEPDALIQSCRGRRLVQDLEPGRSVAREPVETFGQ